MEKEAFEPTGLIPRSIIRTVDRFVQQLLPGREKIALQEYRVSRYQILVSIKSLLTLILIPLVVNFTIKALVFTPLIEHFWNSRQTEIFLNQYQEKRAFSEMHDFSEKMFFESLLIEPKIKPIILLETFTESVNFKRSVPFRQKLVNTYGVNFCADSPHVFPQGETKKSLASTKEGLRLVEHSSTPSLPLRMALCAQVPTPSVRGDDKGTSKQEHHFDPSVAHAFAMAPHRRYGYCQKGAQASLLRKHTEIVFRNTKLAVPSGQKLTFARSLLYPTSYTCFATKNKCKGEGVGETFSEKKKPFIQIEAFSPKKRGAPEGQEEWVEKRNTFRSVSSGVSKAFFEKKLSAPLARSSPLFTCPPKTTLENDTAQQRERQKRKLHKPCFYQKLSFDRPPLEVTFSEKKQSNLIDSDNDKYQKLFQKKSLELAKRYNKQSILAITNLLGDFLTFFTLSFLFRLMRPELIILKSFLTESVYSLSDTTKSFLLILGMDLLVGFHSPRGWELVLELFLRHVGLPENENFILLFVALFPVFLDTVFKYWIFRYLNKISPSTVVTYHSMIE